MGRLQGVASVLLAGLLVSSTAGVHAQEPLPGSVTGLVRDESGAGVPGVTVDASPPGGGPVRPVVTDAAGRYRIDALPPGTWTVSFHLLNFASVITSGVNVRSGTATTVDTTLRLRLTS